MVENSSYCFPKDSFTGNEMFSRVGKYTNNKYIILTKRDSIVPNEDNKIVRRVSVPDIQDSRFGNTRHKRTSEPFIQEFCFITNNNQRKNVIKPIDENKLTTLKKKESISPSVPSTFKKINQKEYSVYIKLDKKKKSSSLHSL